MIQDQLVDYISSQMKLGVPRESVKTALVGVGWAAQDVEDTLKKVEGGPAAPAASMAPAAVKPMAQTQPQVSSAASASPSMSSMASAAAAKNPAPQTIRVSDLVSASLTPTGATMGAKVSPMKMNMNAGGMGQNKAAAPAMGMGTMAKRGMGKSAYVMIGLILVLAGVSALLYFQNSTLSSQLQAAGGAGAASGAGGAAAAQVTTLNGQVAALTASGTALTTQIADLTAQITALQADLSFLMIPIGQTAGVPVEVTVSGTLSGGKPTFVITTAEGVKVAVKNSTDANVKAALAPLMAGAAAAGATSTPVQFAGTHLPGVANITVTAVNGQPVTAPVVPAVPATTTTGATTTPVIMASTTASSSAQ